MIIYICIVLLLYSIIVTIGLIKGMKKSELYEQLYNTIKINVHDAYENMRKVDTLGAFEADDDVGYTFQSLYDIVYDLENNVNSDKMEV